jgi:hypothetical protein
VRAERLLRRENKRRRRRLAAELAAYTSQADLDDLHALLETYPPGQTEEIRQILGQQAGVRLSVSLSFVRPGGGPPGGPRNG